MKTLYIDCSMGAAGDMLTGALLDLVPDRETAVQALNDLNIPGVEYRVEHAKKCGISGIHVHVLVNGSEENERMYDHPHGHGVDEGGHDHPHGHGEEHGHGHPHGHGVDEHGHDHPHGHGGEGHGHDHPHGHGVDEHVHDHPHGHTHHHASMHHIEHIVRDLHLDPAVEQDVLEVYRMIAEAESQVHGMPVSEIHFHEVGTMDAVADVAAVCTLMHRISPDRVLAGALHVGSGTVRCAHGILPVPAPATALLLRGLPVYSDGVIRGELITPTGAALLRHFVDAFDIPLPKMSVSAIGYGMGTRDYERANCVRMFLGDAADVPAGKSSLDAADGPAGKNCLDAAEEPAGKNCRDTAEEPAGKNCRDIADGPAGKSSPDPAKAPSGEITSRPDRQREALSGSDAHLQDRVISLECNVDDMTAEEIGFAMDRLFEAGALDVFTLPAGMKKNRPGTLISVLCREESREEMLLQMFRHTTTIGVREMTCRRYVLSRTLETVETPLGPVRRKIVSGYGTERAKWEYDDLAGAAEKNGLSLRETTAEICSGLKAHCN